MELVSEIQTAEERIPCQFCNRKFVPQSLSKHVGVCEKMFLKKRKTFDSAKQRIQGTELAEFTASCKTCPSNIILLKEPVITPLKKNTAVARRNVSRVNHSVKSNNYERCEYCDRTFGPKAFDRHVEWCKEKSTRINSTSLAIQEAKERLAARIKYRAPSFRSKPGVCRSTYSPKCLSRTSPSLSVQSDHFITSGESDKIQEFVKELRVYEKNNPPRKTNFIRQNVLRYSYKPRVSSNQTKIRKEQLIHASNNGISANAKRVQQHIQSTKFSCTPSLLDTCDPFELAEKQLQNLLNDSDDDMDYNIKPVSSTEQKCNKYRNNKENISTIFDSEKAAANHTIGSPKECFTFIASPTSAFDKYLGSENKHSSSTPNSDNRDKNFLPVIGAKKRLQEPNNMSRYPLISLSNLSLCSSISLDMSSSNENRKGSLVNDDTSQEEIENSFNQSIMGNAGERSKTPAKKTLRMTNLLFGDECKNELSNNKCGDKSGFLERDRSNYSDDDHCTASSGSPPLKQTSSDQEKANSLLNKISIDSAYNSLSRKSPSDILPSDVNADAAISSNFAGRELPKLSKFCHECGAKFPISIAKFCCECGVRRLAI